MLIPIFAIDGVIHCRYVTLAVFAGGRLLPRQRRASDATVPSFRGKWLLCRVVSGRIQDFKLNGLWPAHIIALYSYALLVLVWPVYSRVMDI